MFVGVSVIDPAAVGVIVKVCVVDELVNVRTIGESPADPVPVGVIVIVPVKVLFGVIEKFVEVALILPDVGPVKVNVVAAAAVGVTEFDATDAVDVPIAFVAVTVNVYAVPFVSPVTVIGLEVPVVVMFPGDEVTV